MDLNLNFGQILQIIRQLSLAQKKEIQHLLSKELQSDDPKNQKPSIRKAGSMKGFVTYMARDFDAPLDDMKPYME